MDVAGKQAWSIFVYNGVRCRGRSHGKLPRWLRRTKRYCDVILFFGEAWGKIWSWSLLGVKGLRAGHTPFQRLTQSRERATNVRTLARNSIIASWNPAGRSASSGATWSASWTKNNGANVNEIWKTHGGSCSSHSMAPGPISRVYVRPQMRGTGNVKKKKTRLTSLHGLTEHKRQKWRNKKL